MADEEKGVHDAKMTNLEPIVSMPLEGPSMINPSEILAPSFRLEDQEKVATELQETNVIGPPGYASPDPNTQKGLLVPVEDHPLSGDISEDYGASVANPSEVVPTESKGATAGTGGDAVEIPDNVEEWTKRNWQEAAKSRGLGTSGSIATLKDRIEEHDKEQTARDEEESEIRGMSREELDKAADDFDIDPEDYSRAEDLASALIAASRGEAVPTGDKADENNE